MTTTMTKKIFGGALVALMTLGLAGCAESTTPATKTNHPQTAKVTQAPSAKKASHETSAKANTETKQAASQASSQVTTSQTSASYTAQQSVTPRQAEQVTNQFTQTSGIKQHEGQTYTVTQPNAKEGYQIDVRDNNGDPNVSHLEGIYKFNPQTNTVQQMNPMTGEFEDK